MNAQGQWDDVDTQKLIDGIARQIRGLANHVDNEDAWVLAEITKLQASLEQAKIATVLSLRDRGYQWAEIGRQFGIDRAACYKRYARYITHEGES